MRMYNNVKLNTEIGELAERGIYKGCTGIILDIKADVYFVYFRNDKNYGDYACINLNKKYLDFWMNEPEEDILHWKRFKASGNFKTQFKVNVFNEFDWVEVLVEKEEYAKEGLHKGMLANVAFDYAINGKLPVIFPDEEGYDREVSVNLDDIKLRD